MAQMATAKDAVHCAMFGPDGTTPAVTAAVTATIAQERGTGH
eukprot:CAMPEP_0174371652 /NCGR_PEP_ID=MMETSP0811_2-20130205/100554_1 /TAXON_ID=73025 ORGANISM="Eutreptiella gymnastica-like, Strain CCMP1594" /NCGR_SAMPLE_ID=MMETSP0811_2 /ASSEMBLY_ACC=CAM_ASM_000667 /LENGTH=41 /DNA_ID= /DNA_START= /DNA_END= /DNA_ORIENTATION=